MKRRGCAISLALAGLVSVAAPAIADPGSSAELEPAPADVLAVLPPGARTPGALAGPAPSAATITEDDGVAHRTVVERLERPENGAGPGWVEVEYTIDPQLEDEVRALLKRSRVRLGHVIVMDPSDGEVLSYVSTDPDAFPATRAYPTASLMKVVTAAAVLRRAPDAATRECRYLGNPHVVRRPQLTPPRSGGRVDSFWRALAISNNQCFARLAVDDLGKQAMLEEMQRVGMLEPPAAGHMAGRVEPIESELDLGHLGAGLDGSFISPLAAARLAGVLARGELVHPYWIARVTNARGEGLALPPPQPPRSVWPTEVTDELRELMVGVTARGTAKSAFRDARGRPLLGPVRVSGKTGSLSGRDPTGRYEWFIGVAPERHRLVAQRLPDRGRGAPHRLL
jgi:cell division protein FtsI/penicillin-binding protein 2